MPGGGPFTLDKMRSREIQKLIDAVEAVHGSVELYGSGPSEEHGTCFTIAGVPATFSVLTLDGTLPLGRHDVQIEGEPLGTTSILMRGTLEEFLELVVRMSRPEDTWPTMS